MRQTHESDAFAGLRLTPFHLAGFGFLLFGLVLGIYQGLQALGVVPIADWITWSHIHFVTVGAFTQLVFGMLPQLTARRLRQRGPSRLHMWSLFVGLNGGFVLAWIGRSWAYTGLFDVGLGVIMLSVLGLFVLVLVPTLRAERGDAWNGTVLLYLVAPIVFLYGLTLAFGLYSHVNLFDLPGGWWGMREAHVHANAWGFLGLIAIGTLYDLFPKLVDVELYSQRMKAYSVWFLVLGIGPLAIGPAMGWGRTVTATGLVLFAIGFLLFFLNLVNTLRAGTASGLSWSVLLAQVWVLGPAGFAPFILFGVPLGIPEARIEAGALHFFFLGWALPLALAGLAVYFENLPRFGEVAAEPGRILPAGRIPHDVIRPSMVWAWNLSVLLAGISLFYPDATWSAWTMPLGFGVIVLIWGYYLARLGNIRWGSGSIDTLAS